METTAGDRLAALLGLAPAALVRPHYDELVTDPAATLRSQLASPLEFPPLAEATVPGDRAAVAVAAGVPQAERLALGAVRAFCDAGVEPANVAVVVETPLAHRDWLEGELADQGLSDVTIELHDPAEETACAMVGVTAADRPLRLNRTLVDADVVLPIGVARLEPGGQADGAKFAALLPGFSDAATQQRFRRNGLKESPKANTAANAEVDEAGWLLGVLMSVQVAPGPDDSLRAVVVGESGVAAEAARELAVRTWSVDARQSAELVIAVVGANNGSVGWDEVARALLAAQRVRRPGGAIAVCTDLAARPAGALRRLIDADDYRRVETKLLRDDKPHAWAALQLCRAVAEGPVYMQSNVRPGEVESLGMTPIAGDAELARLVASRGSCLLLDQADRLALK